MFWSLWFEARETRWGQFPPALETLQSYLGGSSCLTGGAPDLLDCPEEQQEEGRGLHCCMEGTVHPNDLILVFLGFFYLRGLQ